jgi:Pyrimidine dimer DNA glycosylase
VKIWALPVGELDTQRLLGEHAELHALYATITRGYRAWSRHPETLRFRDHLGQLVARHRKQVEEFAVRGITHRSPLVDPPPEEPYAYSQEMEERDRRLLHQRRAGRR